MQRFRSFLELTFGYYQFKEQLLGVYTKAHKFLILQVSQTFIMGGFQNLQVQRQILLKVISLEDSKIGLI